MAGILTERFWQFPNIYWQSGQPIGAPVSNLRQIKYLPLPNALPDLDQALSGARIDCGRDFHKQLIEFGGAAKVRMTVQIEYERVNPLVNKQPFKLYLSAVPTRMFKRNKTIFAFENHYIDSLRIITDQITEFNAKFIRDKSNIRLARVLQFTLKIVKYAPLEGRGWKPLPEFLSKNKAVINILNDDELCFGNAVLFFVERPQLSEWNFYCKRAYFYTNEMFHRNNLDILPYPSLPNDVHLYVDFLQMNINLFFFCDDEGRVCHPLVNSRKNFDNVANLLYWKEHYPQITSIPRLFADTTTKSLKTYLPEVPRSLFIGGSSRARQTALHQRRLHVGAPCYPGAHL